MLVLDFTGPQFANKFTGRLLLRAVKAGTNFRENRGNVLKHILVKSLVS